MTAEEQMIWRAVYAAAFVQDYEGLREAAEQMPSQERKGVYPSDMAMDKVSVELACTIADLSVRKLREWRKEENPNAGLIIEE